jgi:hypothetical protein
LEPSGKGEASVSGLDDLVSNLQQQLEIEIGVLAVVANRVKGTNDQHDVIESIKDEGFDVPTIVGDRTSLLEGCWREQCSAFSYVREHRSRRRDYEVETLAQFDELARHIESSVGLEAPNPPEPGVLNEPAEVKA